MIKKTLLLIYPFAILVMFLLLTYSCKKDEPKVPVLTTYAVSDIKTTSATSGGNICSDGGSPIKFYGVCWSTNPTPTRADSKTIDGGGSESYTSKITGLKPNTTYFVCAYATNIIGTAYGSVMSFATLPGGSSDSVTDIDGNVYHSVIIGNQIWMVENLKVTHYSNGDAIPNITDNLEWSKLSTGAYCEVNNSSSFSVIYGNLYNWYAVHDSRNIAPTGWHIPTSTEWTILTDYLGGENVAGGKLKETGYTHWTYPNTGTGATNETGFLALPAGYRFSNGTIYNFGLYSYLWSTSMGNSNYAWYRYMCYNSSNVYSTSDNKTNGFSVRCLRDK